MKRMRSLNQMSHCTGSKSYARATYEHVCVIYIHLIYVDLINYVHLNTYSKIMFLFYLFM
jgi:hypothetical protein